MGVPKLMRLAVKFLLMGGIIIAIDLRGVGGFDLIPDAFGMLLVIVGLQALAPMVTPAHRLVLGVLAVGAAIVSVPVTLGSAASLDNALSLLSGLGATIAAHGLAQASDRQNLPLVAEQWRTAWKFGAASLVVPFALFLPVPARGLILLVIVVVYLLAIISWLTAAWLTLKWPVARRARRPVASR